MRDLTSQSQLKDVLVTEPDRAFVVKSSGRPPKTKRQLASLEVEGAFENDTTKWWFRLILKFFGR